MHPRCEKDVLQNAVAEAGYPLLRRQERLEGQSGNIRVKEGVEVGLVKTVGERGRLLLRDQVVLVIVPALRERHHVAVHLHRTNQERTVIELQQQLVLARRLLTGPDIAQVHSIAEQQPRIAGGYLYLSPVAHGLTYHFAGQQGAVVLRVAEIPGELVRTAGSDDIPDVLPTDNLVALFRQHSGFR
jgi:hypothetical protein